jgi:hypothetical protein
VTEIGKRDDRICVKLDGVMKEVVAASDAQV